LKIVEDQIESAVKGGATMLLGGKRVDRPGYFLEPTILTNVKPDNPVFYQEFFAPVALIFRVKNEAEAVKLANDSPYGLGGSIITKDIERGKRLARQIDTGMVFINQATWTAPDLPFGGVKNSGYGRELSDLGIGEFVNKKLIRVA
jgi:succinate-semialdehyde dehydrogenase/glutarate-semialdehyde dehydrogenase